MSDGLSMLHIKQENDTSPGTSQNSPTTPTHHNGPMLGLSGGLKRSRSCSSSSKASNVDNSNNDMKSSPSVSPERQFCSSLSTLSGELNGSVVSNSEASPHLSINGNGNGNGHGSVVSSSGTSTMRDELRRLCLVCGDVASGFHYGVASCEACKAFFKRTIQGNIEYTCPATNECEINKRRRKACQACRFQKCLLMGMLKEGVRLDRVRGGRQKYRRNPVSNSYQTMQLLFQSNTTTISDVKILEALSSNEPDPFSVKYFNASKSIVIGNELAALNGSTEMSPFDDDHTINSAAVTCIFQNNNNDPKDILNVLAELYDQELLRVIGWAKQIPGFINLPINDQMKLLEISWVEVLTLQLTFRSLPFNGKLCFATDLWMDELLAKECGYIDYYYHCVQIAQRLERISIRREEYALLKALVLSNCDILLDDQSSLRAFRDSILNALNDVVYLLRHSAAVSHQQQLLLMLPALRQADGILRNFWREITGSETVELRKLFLEMLNPITR